MTALAPQFAVIGHPVAQSQSPKIHKVFGQQFGLDIDYGVMDVTPEEFDNVVTAFFAQGGQGLNVTVPHKGQAAKWVDQCRPRAAQAGAVNTIGIDAAGATWGDNTDGAGLVNDLTRNHDLDPHGMRILVLGAGGSARGVITALMPLQPADLAIANRTHSRAKDLAEIVEPYGSLKVLRVHETPQKTWDLIINTTSAGLTGNVPSLPDTVITPSVVLYDLQYGAAAEPLKQWAGTLGARTLTGWGMLVEQAALAFSLWHQLTPDTQALLSDPP